MKNGKPIFIGLLLGVVLYEVVNKKKFEKQIKDNVTMTQYRNRLSEFFDGEEMNKAIDDMSEYIGYGLSAKAAFDIMIAGDL
jgi:hypothetical protein